MSPVERITTIIKFKTMMLKASLWDYSYACILVEETIAVLNKKPKAQ